MPKNITDNKIFIEACLSADSGQYSKGLNLFYKLERRFPDDAQLHFLMGFCEFELQQYEDSEKRLKRCIQLNSRLPKAHHLLGNILRDSGEFESALHAYNKEIVINPNYPDVLNDLGVLYFSFGKFEEAIDTFDLAISLDRDYADPYQNKAMVYVRQKKFAQANQLLGSAIKLKIDNYEAIAVLANTKKHICEFNDAWTVNQLRFELELKDEKKYFTKPLWSDPYAKDKVIYLYCEQGIGDQILYGTMFNEAFKTQNKFIVSVDRRLKPLFERSFSPYLNIRFIEKLEPIHESLFDLQLPMGDLGKFFRKNLVDFERFSYPYLSAKKIRTDLIEDTSNNKRMICGISWRSASPKIGVDKSLALLDLKDILKIKYLLFLDLQYGDTLDERTQLKKEYDITLCKVDEIDNFNDIEGLASLIESCDFIVTISNVTAHIAGALNKDTYLLVPYSKGRCWYWHHEHEKSIWYPSIQIFTQTEAGDWSVPINKIKEKIVDMSHD